MKDDVVHKISGVQEGDDDKYNPLEVSISKDGHVFICKDDSYSEDSIYFYPKQALELLKILKTLKHKKTKANVDDKGYTK